MLNLNTWQDPAYGNEWVAGRALPVRRARTYGAYFVRSRVTGAGPTGVQLLWPAGNQWPPEIDFNETGRHHERHLGDPALRLPTTARTSGSSQDRHDPVAHLGGHLDADLGHVHGRRPACGASVHVASEISNVPMTLDLTQQTWCASGWACPSSPQSMQVDWVAEYTS